MFYNGIGDGVSAEQVLSLAHTLAPNKQNLSFILIRAYLTERKFPEAYALAKQTYDIAPVFTDAAKWYVLTAVYDSKFSEARAHIAANGQTVPFDNDILGALVSSGQIQLAIQLLQELKKTNPELATQVDAYIKQLLAQPRK
jgi:hypothetical protein